MGEKLFQLFIILVFLTASCNDQEVVKLAKVEPDYISYHKPQNVDFKGKYLIGAAYYPEQWDKNRWEEDFRKMNELGINVIRMGEFAWSHFEPNPGHFNFTWMDEAIALAAKYNISTILCTPTASLPPWLVQLHPDVLSGNSRGKYDYGCRKGQNTNSQNLNVASDRIVKAMAEHFGNNLHIIGWQLDNEPGYPFAMYDNLTTKAFQNWLARKYISTDSLNKSWNTVFWGHEYNKWSEVLLPPLNTADGDANPGMAIDYRRFFSDSFLDFLKRQESILRQYIGTRFIYTNWPNTFWSIDIHKASGFLDFSGWDNYTAQAGVYDFKTQYVAGLNHDLARCANKHQVFIISEQDAQPTTVGKPEGVRLKTYLDLAHGSYGTLFFEWRPPLNGAEHGYASLLQLDGSFGPSAPQLKKLNAELSRIFPLVGNAKTESDIAIIYSYENQWFQGWWNGKGYDNEALRYYTGLKSLKRNIDVVSVDQDYSKYKLIAAPGLRMVSNELAARLKNFVSNGGILVLNKEAGTKLLSNTYREANTPGIFMEMAGVDIPWISNRVERDGLIHNTVSFSGKEVFEPDTYMDWINLKTAQPLATFAGGNLQGKPAVTINQFGKGCLIYVGADSKNTDFYESLASSINMKLGSEPIMNVPEAVEVVSRSTKDDEFIFLLNLEDKENKVKLQSPLMELISGRIIQGEVQLKPLDVAVLRRPQK